MGKRIAVVDTEFQSTRPARDATSILPREYLVPDVSIHASRAGRDPAHAGAGVFCQLFQSTRPARDATHLGARGG